MFQANAKQKKTEVAILSDNTDFKPMTVTGDKEGHYIIIKESIHQEDISLVNIYALHIETPKYIKQMLIYLKGVKYCNIIIAENFNTALSTVTRFSRWKINNEILT